MEVVCTPKYGNKTNAFMESFWGSESNPCANPKTANNGGGYSQPCGGILVALANGEYITVTVEDLSCGDFGTRVYWDMACTDGRSYGGGFGSMDDASIDNGWSEESLDSISGVYGVDARAMLRDAISAVHFAADAV